MTEPAPATPAPAPDPAALLRNRSYIVLLVFGAVIGVPVAMLGLPLVSVLLVALFLQADALSLMPLVIVAVVVSHVASAHLAPRVEPGTPAVAGDGAGTA